MDCIRTPVIRFKHAAGQQSMQWSPEQTWTQPKAGLRYYDETPELVDFYHGDITTLPRGGTSSDAVPIEDLSKLARSDLAEHSSVSALDIVQRHEEPLEVQSSVLHEPLQDGTQDRIDLGLSPFANNDNISGTSPGTNSQTNQSPWTLLSMESNDMHTPQQQPSQALSETEALLLRNFTENMALWADGPDPQRSFELEASRIALTDPVLRHAICAFSSRHVRRQNIDRDAEALEHQDACLQLLIPAMSSQHSMSEGVLAAVAILRQNEEMDECDNRFHLEGVTRILNDVSAFASSGGLREATAWLCLREDIYVSLTTQTILRTSLPPFESATWIQGVDDYSWTNRMVLLLAKLLSVAFLDISDLPALANIRRHINEWDATKPHTFTPIYLRERHPSRGQFLPEIWMLAPSHAIGLQYYHIAQLVLAVSARVTSARPFDHIHEHRNVERQVRYNLLRVVGIARSNPRYNLLRVVGIARSNPRAQNTWFTAHHCLQVWGGSLRKNGDQQACLAFLHAMGDQTGWRVGQLMRTLTSQWEDDSE
ncbi:hypothetical protein Slin15195_G056500 [Septoria linicola]|uniref:Uncharacterized protein n=1 Tax=Septoria linicola TaxID=215465 RepID=A0A9Q9AX94_9PEZI|nr:hypothetical protein Slin14017_G072380 [Septoria linicola]USW52331.1 hypothetical protein Slin15195_G056500 [Septoria linicola]